MWRREKVIWVMKIGKEAGALVLRGIEQLPEKVI
jgi:hypothetical protein